MSSFRKRGLEAIKKHPEIFSALEDYDRTGKIPDKISRKRLVIIGGGFAGTHIANTLQKQFAVTIIDTKDYFEFTPSVLRAVVEPDHAQKIQVRHRDYLKEGTVIVGKVTLIAQSLVFIGRRSIPYDYLVIATGSYYNAPFKEKNVVVATRLGHIKETYDRISAARNILIIGGGIVGVELAAEIATHFSEKNITLVHSRSRLMQRQPERASRYTDKFLRKRGVEIIYDERVTTSKKGTFFTNEKKEIPADLAFLCTGITPNCTPFERPLNLFVMCDDFLIVNKYLQLGDCKNIFAAGDIVDTGEEKTAQNAEEHARIIIQNLKRMEEEKVLVPYNAAARVMVISLGKYRGVLTYKNFALTGIIPGILKSIIEWKTMRRYW